MRNVKYKIIKITTNNKIHYEIKQKGLFFWHTIMDFEVGVDGSYWEYPKEFNSIENAEDYLKK